MTTDKELLELSAKAAGIEIEPCTCSNKKWPFKIKNDFGIDHWNPLEDDGDALRLAVNLQLGISIPPVVDGRIEVVTFYGPIVSIVEHPQNNDRNAATRRAIVRAAAEIGKAMS